MKEIEIKIIKRTKFIQNIDKDFWKLWQCEDSLKKHIQTRLRRGHIKDRKDYIFKTLECLAECETYIFAKHKNSWDNLCYNKKREWAVIFNMSGVIMTSYKIEPDLKSFEQLHEEVGGEIEKGEVSEEFRKTFERLRDRYRELGK